MNAETFWREVPVFNTHNKSRGLSAGTLRLYNLCLRFFYEWFIQAYGGETKITARHIREWVAYRFSLGNKPATVRAYIDTLRGFYNFLVLDEVMQEDENPMRLIKNPRVPMPKIRPLNEEEIKMLLKSFDMHSLTGFRDYTMCVLLLDTGLRAGEATSLVIEDIDFGQSRIMVKGKGQKIRFVYMGEKVQGILRNYINRCRPWLANGHPALFPPLSTYSKNATMHPKRLSAVLREKFEELGIPNGYSSTHRLRHTFATNFVRNGGGVFPLQRILGHSTVQMTMRYVMLAEDDLREAHKKASPIDRMGL